MNLPDFIQKAAERAIEDATNVTGMRTNGPCYVKMELSQFRRLLLVAMAAEHDYKQVWQAGHDKGLEDGKLDSDSFWTNASGMGGFDKL